MAGFFEEVQRRKVYRVAAAVPILRRLLQKPGALTVMDKIRNDHGFQKLLSDRETRT